MDFDMLLIDSTPTTTPAKPSTPIMPAQMSGAPLMPMTTMKPAQASAPNAKPANEKVCA